MQCSRCGASVRPGMTECPACGAPLAASMSGSLGNRGADRYIPGGGAQQQPGSNQEPEQLQRPQSRPLGSLQRRLQASQMSIPPDGDDGDDGEDDRYDTPPPRSGRSRGPARRPSQGGSRSRGGEQRRGGYDAYGDSREEEAYSPYPPYRADDDESRERPAPRRAGGANRYRPERMDRIDRMDESAEMSAEGPAYGGPAPRSSPRRRSRPMDGPRDESDYTNPLDDPRSPLRGSQGRRPTQGSGGRGGRSSGAGGYGRGGYTEAEMRAQGYQDDDRYRGYPNERDYPDYRGGYSEEAPAARGGSRGRGGYPMPYERDDYVSREQWAAPGSDRDAGYSAYGEAYGEAYGGGYRQGPQGERGGFAESAELWQPVGGAGRAGAAGARGRPRGGGSGGARAAAKKRRGGALRMVIGLLVMLALVAVVGVEFGPKVYNKYIAHTSGSGGNGQPQTSITCASQATPSAQIKPATGFTAFATTAYALTYPTGWQTTSQSSASQGQCDVVFLFTQPNGGAARFNVEEAGAFTPLSDIQIIQAEAQAAQQQGSTFVEITSAATTQQVGGEVWQRREYQVTATSGVKLHLALLATHHKGAGFAIVMISSDTGFASDDTTTFEKMLTSFQFV